MYMPAEGAESEGRRSFQQMRLSVFQCLSLGMLFALSDCKVNSTEFKVKVKVRVEIQESLDVCCDIDRSH